MRRRPGPVAAVLALLLVAACESFTETDITDTGTMVFVDDDAPCWLIDTGERRYLPINLPSEFEEAGIRVRFEARRSAGGTVCGGFVIELVSIERL